jgi:hypothetical protein
MQIKTLIRLIIISVLLIVTSIACRASSQSKSKILLTLTPSIDPGEPLIIVQGEQIVIEITEAQITERIKQNLGNIQDYKFSDINVRITNGALTFFAKVETGLLTFQSKVALTIGLSSEGAPVVTLTQIDLGGITLPDAVAQQLTSLINDGITQYISSQTQATKITSITLSEGKLVIEGERQ